MGHQGPRRTFTPEEIRAARAYLTKKSKVSKGHLCKEFSMSRETLERLMHEVECGIYQQRALNADTQSVAYAQAS